MNVPTQRERLAQKYGDEEDLFYLPENFFDVIDELPGIIRERASTYYPEIGHRPFLVREKAVSRSTYPIFAYQISAAGFVRDIYVKFAPVYPQKNEGLVEYENLQLIWKNFRKDGGYGSPKPLDFIHELNALVVEGVPGVPFLGILLRDNWYSASSLKRKNLERIVARCGYWLREFHQAAGIESVPCGDIHAWLPREDLTDCLPCKRLTRSARDILNNLSGMDWRGMVLPVSRIHGDLALDNILTDGQTVNVLDVSYNKRDAIYADVASFLANLLTVNTMPKHPLYDSRQVRNLSRAFLAAYGIEDFRNHTVLLKAYLVRAVLTRCVEQRSSIEARIHERLRYIPMIYLHLKYYRILTEIDKRLF